MANELNKPVIGFSCGDLNGIGIEIILKTLNDSRLLEICVPVIFASTRSLNFYRKSFPDLSFTYNSLKDIGRINYKQINVFNCWEEDVAINPGQLNEAGGKYALLSLKRAVQALKDNHIHGLVTAPVHKKNIQSQQFNYSGHTPYLKAIFNADDVVMLLSSSNMRVALVTEHIAVNEIAQYITKENIVSKLKILNHSLQKDFGTDKPKIAVLALNPHAGDEGLIGKQEEDIIKPVIKLAADQKILAFGPYSADAFFARSMFNKFDAVLAMYHDQGLIPFKSISVGEGVNFTAGLPVVRTSPDHGTAFDIAGKGVADASSFLAATFECIDIIRRRKEYEEAHKNPLRKISDRVLANVEDEKIEQNEN